MTEQFGPVGVSIGDGVATVIVDHPPVNAMGRGVLAGLGQAAERVGPDHEVRAVVLSGTGQAAFMAGADISEFQAMRAEPGAMDKHSRMARGVFDAWQALPQPVIAAVQASAVGGGLEIALLCDLIVADPAAKFGLPEVKLGLIPGGGGTQRLPARIGVTAAKEMLFTGSLISAPRAAELGLVNQVSEPGRALAAAQVLAARIAALPRVAVTCAKRAVNGAVPASALDREREIFLETFGSEDFTEGFAAFLDKRKPVFTHR
jgi:enoyl-CoA hydratase/carnithine racemase